MANGNGSEAVKKYLLAINNPGALQDEARLNELQEAIANTDDVLERVKLKAEAKRLSEVSAEDYEQGFIENAKAWAEQNDVPASVLADEGVDSDVLKRAGFDVAGKTKSTRRRSTGKRVSKDDVKDAIKTFADPFTVDQAKEVSGASPATVRKALSEMVDAGQVKEAGEIETDSQGRNPTAYENVK